MQPVTAVSMMNHFKSVSTGTDLSLYENLKADIEARYGLETVGGKFMFVLEALYNLKLPSSYLESKTLEALRSYRQTAPYFRNALVNLQASIFRGKDLPETGKLFHLSDATQIFLKVQKNSPDFSAQDTIAVKVGEGGEWIDLDTSLESLLTTVEDEIMYDSSVADIRTIGAFNLRPAVNAVIKVAQRIPANVENPVEELYTRVLTPDGDADAQSIMDNLEEISRNLIAFGIYKKNMSIPVGLGDEQSSTITILFGVLQYYIHQNVDCILMGNTTNSDEIARALKLLDMLPPESLESGGEFSEVRDKIVFIENYTGLPIEKAAINNTRNLMTECMEVIVDKGLSFERAKCFSDLEKVIIDQDKVRSVADTQDFPASFLRDEYVDLYHGLHQQICAQLKLLGMAHATIHLTT